MSCNRAILNSISRSTRIALKRSPVAAALTAPRPSLPSVSPLAVLHSSPQKTQRCTMATFASSLVQPAGPRPSIKAASPVQKPLVHNRNISDGERIGKIYSTDDIKAVAGKDSGVVLVDTREPHELAELGRIPGAINIPIDSAPDSFYISEEDFEKRFGYNRPAKDARIVTYCRAGVRCHIAAQVAKQAGFTDVNEYPGSFNDWIAGNGEVERK